MDGGKFEFVGALGTLETVRWIHVSEFVIFAQIFPRASARGCPHPQQRVYDGRGRFEVLPAVRDLLRVGTTPALPWFRLRRSGDSAPYLLTSKQTRVPSALRQ